MENNNEVLLQRPEIVYQYTGYFVAEGHRKQFFIGSGNSRNEAQTCFFELIEEYATEMECKDYEVEVNNGIWD